MTEVPKELLDKLDANCGTDEGRPISNRLLEAHHKLISLAATMVQGKGLPSPYLEDHIPIKLSKKARRYFETQLEMVDEKAKLWGLELRKIADSLASNAVLTGAKHGDKHGQR